MSTVRMQVVPPNKTPERDPIEATTAPAITGKGETDFVCGSCGSTLLRRMYYAQVRDLVLRCSRCGATNEIPPPRRLN
jgi:predicted RNA-binding Zn-ribbon protein involved in translation (DUF1610 family)